MQGTANLHTTLKAFSFKADIELYLELQHVIAERDDARFFEVTLDPLEAQAELRLVTGYWIYHCQQRAGFISHQRKNDRSGHICEIAVLPIFRRMGIGKTAISLIMEQHYPDVPVRLRVDPHNAPALMAYLKCGFVIERMIENATSNGRPRLIMLRPKP